jgi:hypothetical protein
MLLFFFCFGCVFYKKFSSKGDGGVAAEGRVCRSNGA